MASIYDEERLRARFKNWIQGVGVDAVKRQNDSVYEHWLREMWNGDEHLLIATCLAELDEAFGTEWRTLTEYGKRSNFQFFSAICALYRRPDSETTYLAAEEHRNHIGIGNLHVFTEELARIYPRLRKSPRHRAHATIA